MKCPVNGSHIIVSYELNNHIFDGENISDLPSGVFDYTTSSIDGNNLSLVISENPDPLTDQDYNDNDFLDELKVLLEDGWSGFIVVLDTETGELEGYSLVSKISEIGITPFIALPDPTRLWEIEVIKAGEE